MTANPDPLRAKSTEEVRQEFLHHIRWIANYWATIPDKTPEERTSGTAFSILNIFDGTTYLPAMKIVVQPDPENVSQDIFINDCDALLHELLLKEDL